MWKKIDNDKILAQLQEVFKNDQLEGDRVDARDTYYFLRDALREGGVTMHASERAKAYFVLMYQAGLFSISLLREEDVLDIFQNGLPYLFSMNDFDFLSELKKFFIFNPDQKIIVDRVLFKEKLQKILEEHEGRMEGEKGIPIGNNNLRTIGNWVKDYLAYVEQKEPDVVRFRNYLTAWSSTKGITEEDRRRVEMLLKIYDHMRLASFKPFLLEESFVMTDETGTYFVEEGRVEKTDESVQEKMKQIHSILEEENGARVVMNAYIATPNKVIVPTLRNINQLFGIFRQGVVDEKTRDEIIASLRQWAEKGNLMEFLKDAKTFSELREEFESAKTLSQAQRSANIPESLQFLSAFLRWVLEERLGMTSAKSAEEAVRIANIIKRSTGKDYLALAYYDLKTKQFQWS